MNIYEKYNSLINECEDILSEEDQWEITESQDILSEAGEWKIVFRGKKKVRKLICPPGMKADGKKCKKMSSSERAKRRKALRIAGMKMKQKMGKILKKRAKAMKKRRKMGI